MGKNFIGPEELYSIRKRLGISMPLFAPPIPFDEASLQKISDNAILLLGLPMNIMELRSILGTNPKKEPCFYNQDWYFNEPFANKIKLENRWYLIKKTVDEVTRGKNPKEIAQKKNEQLPSAILTAFTFFAYYFLTEGEILWNHDFLWCSDRDSNGDQIYTGRYIDPNGINKNGFNIHRYLSIRPSYAVAPEILLTL